MSGDWCRSCGGDFDFFSWSDGLDIERVILEFLVGGKGGGHGLP